MQLLRFFPLLTGGEMQRRENVRPDATHRAFASFSDHQLRDIGYVRERTVAPRNHVLWL